ncbi:DUF3466 family protein [Gayadomonas joobiniege]|uniref:DUF3466 family protein n=1 Tax=Gayadomonas joobiniege TaxID=1234606 RepID=UPI00037550A2|nr:DUF3466 family protein [Gayadomonas joobiniege]
MKKLIKITSITTAILASGMAHAIPELYQLQVLEKPEEFKNSYPIDINNSGEVITTLSYRFEYPIDEDRLDLDDEDINLGINLSSVGTNGVSYYESVKKGVFNATSLNIVLSYLSSAQTDGQHQVLSSYRTGFADEDEIVELAIFDRENPATEEYFYHNNETARAINNSGTIVGDAESPLVWTDVDGEDWLIGEFPRRGFAKTSKTTVELIPPYDDIFGGYSYVADISDEGYIVGYGSVGETLTLEALEEACEDNDDEIPEKVCLWQNLNRNLSNQLSYYKTHALRWKINASGEVTEVKDLGIGIAQSDVPSTSNYYSRAFSVNNNGTVVGDTHTLDANGNVRQQAALFDGEGGIQILTDPIKYPQSRALKINDNGIVIGTLADTAGLSFVTKSFYYSIDEGTLGVNILTDFFVDAETKARDINNQNIIVGRTETNALSSGARPQHGFVYDIDTEEMTDLNDVLACETDYRIVDAYAINDDGVILAHASLTQQARDRMGDVTSSALTGSLVQEQVEYAVKLVPTATGQYSCILPDNDTTIERKGAAISWPVIFFAFMTFLFKGLRSNRKTV